MDKNYAQIAADNFNKGYNCAQAVACAFADRMGMDEATIAKLVSGFGGGMGKLREVCGAVSGAIFVLNVLEGYESPEADEEKKTHYARVQAFATRFKAEHETIICRELLKNVSLKKTSEPEARTPEYYKRRPCANFVSTAARVLDEMLNEG